MSELAEAFGVGPAIVASTAACPNRHSAEDSTWNTFWPGNTVDRRAFG